VKRLLKRRPKLTASAIVASLLLLLFAFVLLSTVGISSGTMSSGGVNLFGPQVTLHQFRSLRLGASRHQVEQRLGKGKNALDREIETGLAIEPMNATCTYYPQSRNVRNIVQLCFRNQQLISKQRYNATPGPPLEG
jgi:hypothetical protein